MINNIVKTLKLNKKNFDEIKGKRFYYSPQTTWFTAILFFLFLVGFIYLLATNYSLDLIWMIGFLGVLYFLLQMFHKVIYKNPIFIINQDQLFYTKTEKWYDLTKCKVYVRSIGRYNFTGTLFVKCGGCENSFDENYWFIEYDNDLKKIMERYYKD